MPSELRIDVYHKGVRKHTFRSALTAWNYMREWSVQDREHAAVALVGRKTFRYVPHRFESFMDWLRENG
jgi:hypothetical protein